MALRVHSIDFILRHLQQHIEPHRGQIFWIAYSGGLDSHVLLNSMWRIKQSQPSLLIKAIHIHHGLSINANFWLEHCRTVCEALQIEFHTRRIEFRPQKGESIEAWAREARYKIFKDLLAENETLLTAHTQNDQAETLLLQLLRGCGLKGLAGMPIQQKFAKGQHLRPFLQLTRHELQKYAMHYQLTWIEDESNADQRFDRNYLRHQVLPLLQQRWPAATQNIARTAYHCGEASSLLVELAQKDLPQNNQPNSLDLIALQDLSPARQRNVLRFWFNSLKCRVPSRTRLLTIQKDIINGRADSQSKVQWGAWILRRFRNTLQLLQQDEVSNLTTMLWDLNTPLTLPGNLGQLVAVKNQAGGLSPHLDLQKFSIRFRTGGERCRLINQKHSSSLKKLFQLWQIPYWQRNQIPLLFYENELAAVPGYCICAPFAAKQNEIGWSVQLIKL